MVCYRVWFLLLQELGRYKSTTTLPFNAFGTMAMAREVWNSVAFEQGKLCLPNQVTDHS